jgi:iron complex transport system permease protein
VRTLFDSHKEQGTGEEVAPGFSYLRSEAAPVGGAQGATVSYPSDQIGSSRKRARKRNKKDSQNEEGPSSSGPEVKTCDFYEQDRRSTRIKTLILSVALVIVALYSLTLGYDYSGTSAVAHYSLVDAFKTIGTGIQVLFGLLNGSLSEEDVRMIAYSSGMLFDELHRLLYTVVVLLSGMLVSVAGMLFQIVFRNPIASPTILGVTSGVSLGYALMAFFFGTSALSMMGASFIFSFAGGILILLLVLLLGRLTSSESGKFEVKNLLIAGMMVSYPINVIITILTNYQLFPEAHRVYELMTTLGSSQSVTPSTLGIVALASVITMVPIISGRYKYNMLSLTDEEAKIGGIDPSKSRILVLSLGSIMVVAASVLGGITVLALVIPFLARAIYGVEFRKQLLGSILIGMLIIMGCYVLSIVIPFGTTGIPMSIIANVVLIPLFAWVMATNQKALV